MNGVDGIKLGDYKDKAINTSIQLRSKKELINNFISSITSSTKVDDDWRTFVKEQKESDLASIIKDEKLKIFFEKNTLDWFDVCEYMLLIFSISFIYC